MALRTKYPHQRLKAARIAAGYESASEAIEKCKWKNSTYRAHENGQNLFSGEQAELYARAYKVSAQWLLEGDIDPSETTSKISKSTFFQNPGQSATSISVNTNNYIPEFKGGIARGIYREKNSHVSSRLAPRRPLPIDPDYSPESQFDLVVEDNSIYNFAQEGDYLRCLHLKNSFDHLNDGDLVVIERYINSDICETTVRLLRGRPSDKEFILLGLDGPEDGPITFKTLGADKNQSLKIIGKVLCKYRFV